MPTEAEIETFLEKRKGSLARLIRKEPKRAKEVLKQYGAPGLGESMVAGLQQGALHGFADDIERAGRKDRTAKTHIGAQAAHPGGYLLAQLLGLGATGLGLRGSGAAVGKARANAMRRGNQTTIAGGRERQARIENEARKVEKDYAAFPLPGVKPRDRALIMDASHGAALGYGGGDVSTDEKAFSVERALRAGLGGALGLVGGPATTSAATAAGNIPLLFGKRRAFSERRLEPPGVTKATPEGRPREAIDIARSKDEALARGQGEGSALVRDTTPPMQSTRPNTKQLADQALEPIAAQRIDELARQERAAASDAIAAAYPDKRGSRRQQEPDAIPTPSETPRGPQSINEDTFKFIVYGTRESGPPPAISSLILKMTAEGAGDAQIASAMGLSRGQYQRTLQRLLRGDLDSRLALIRAQKVRDEPGFGRFEDPIEARIASEPAPPQMTRAVERFNAGRTPGPARPVIPDATLNAMLEPVVRRDRHAFESWSSKIEAMNRRDPTVLPRLQGAVAAMLARTERRSGGGHKFNDDPTTQLYLRTLGMTGNRTKGTQNVLEAARGPAAEQFNSRRFQDAQARTAGGPRMRSRHAEALRREMEAYTPGEYTGPTVGTMREPLVMRGDDQAAWLSPTDFYLRPERLNNAQVNAAGALAGPTAMLVGDALEPALPHAAANEPIEAEFEELQPRGTLAAIAGPQAPRNAVMQAAAAQNEPITLRQAQQVMIERAGIPLSRFGPDGIMGPETETALRTFQQAAGIPATGELDDMTQARLRQYRDGLLPDEMQREINAALGALGK